MSFDFENAYQLTTPDGEVKEISQNGTTVWERAVSTPAPQNTNFAPTRSGNALGVAITGNSVQSSLPAGYTQLEYIESQSVLGGIAYIDTLFIPTKNSKARVKFCPVAKNGSGFFGARKDIESARFSATTFSQGSTFAFAMTNSTWSSNKTTVTVGNIYDCIAYNGKQIINGTEYTEPTVSNFSTTSTFKLAPVDGNGIATSAEGANTKFYLCQLWENDILVRDFVPAKNSSNEVGMYDLVSKTFFTNAGTGSFTAGAEVKPTPTNPIEVKGVGERELPVGYTQLEYIQSSGTQYIDTGISPAGKKIGAVIDFQFTSTSRSTGGVFGSNKTDGTDNCQFTVYSSKWRIKLNSYAVYGTNYNTNRHTSRCNMPDGTSLDSTVYTTTQYTVESSNNCNVYVGACHYETSASTNIYSLVGKLYSAKVYDDTTLVRDFVPAKNSSNVLGMYDLVSGQFFTNAGTGSFTAGPEVASCKLPITVGSTTYNPTIASPLQKVGTYADSISGSVLTRNIKCVTLSAGTHTLSDAVSDAPYLCTQQEAGTLTGTTLTLGADVSNAEVYYPLATPTTQSFTQPTIPLTKGTTYQWELDTEITPTTSSLNYLGNEGA